jgi:hypothetical protein
MTIDKFPKYQDWVNVIALRDQGVLLVCAAVLFVIAWLIVARFFIPRLMPIVQGVIVVGFYLSLLALAIGVSTGFLP